MLLYNVTYRDNAKTAEPNQQLFGMVSGVGQRLNGLHRGPLLFLLYINDLPNSVPGEKIKLFADDTNLFVCAKTITELESIKPIFTFYI